MTTLAHERGAGPLVTPSSGGMPLEEEEGAQTSSALALAILLEQVIEEQRWAADRILTLKAGLKQSQVRVEELERQLKELTNIEQRIQQREAPGDRKEKE